VSDAVFEGLKAVLGSLAIELAVCVVDVPHAAVGAEDAPELAWDEPVEQGEQVLVVVVGFSG
jgi:hypothetical protein